jgi:hypothetical protein
MARGTTTGARINGGNEEKRREGASRDSSAADSAGASVSFSLSLSLSLSSLPHGRVAETRKSNVAKSISRGK